MRLLVYFLLFISPIRVFCQGDTVFNIKKHYYGSPANTLNYVMSATRTGDHLYLTIGIAEFQDRQSVLIAKTDLFGNVEKEIFIKHPEYGFGLLRPNIMIEDDQGNVLVAGFLWTFQPAPFVGYLVKCSPDLDTLWTRAYMLPPGLAGCPPDTGVGHYFTAIRQTPDGGYVIAGNYRLNCQPGTINDRPFLLKVDTAGEVEWWQVYPNHNMIFDIEVTPDSGFVFLSVELSGLKLIKVDSQGMVEWQEWLDNKYLHRVAQEIEIINDSILVIVGSHRYDYSSYLGGWGLDFFLFNIRSRSLISSHYYKPYMSIRCATLHQNLRLLPLKDGYLIAATASVLSPDSLEVGYKGVLFKLDLNGDSLWIRYYNYGNFTDQCQFNDVLQMDDGGFLAMGFHFPWTSNAGAWLVKTDSLGYAPGSYPTGIQKPPALVASLNIYPNPATDHTWIKLDGAGQAVTLNLLDMSGRIVFSHHLAPHSKEYQLNTSMLKSGIYLVNLTYESGQVITTKLVVR